MSSPIFPRENIETTFHAIIERYQLKPEKNGRYRGFCPVHHGSSGRAFAITLASYKHRMISRLF